MDAIFELVPDITDTQESRSAMIRDAQQFALANKADDDFLVVPSEKNELFEESSTIFTIDGKNIEFDYISSINKNGNFVSFAQDRMVFGGGLYELELHLDLNLKVLFLQKIN